MVDTVGEKPRFEPKPLQSVDKVSVGPRPGLSTRARLVLAGLAATLGLGGAAALGHDPVSSAANVADKAIHFGLEDPQHNATQKVREELATKGIHFGDPKESSIATDPNSGKDGIVWRHGKLGDISISGTVGVKMEMQRLIIRDEASTDGKEISVDDIKKMGVNLDDLWMVEVHGGPITENAEEAPWVGFMGTDQEGKPKTYFAKEEFAKLDGKNKLEVEVHEPLVSVPEAKR